MAGLRTYYSKEFGKEKASMVSGTTTKNIYVSKWPFFTSLSFLRDNITPRKTTSTMVLENEEPNTSKACSPSSDENMNSVFSNNPPASQKSKRKLQMKLEDELLSTCIEELKKPKIEEKPDADASFGKYIVDQLRKVPDGMQKELLKLDIQKLVINAFIPTQESVRRQPFSTINFEDFQ